jgi:homoserine kinase type II
MDKLLKQINELYGLKVHSFEKVSKGSLSENYILLEDNKKYFLKKYRFDNKEKIEEIHRVKKYFSNGGIPVVLPILNKENKTFFCFDNGYFAIFPFIEEKEFERGSLPDEAIISLGKMLGRIHLLGKESNLLVNDIFKFSDKEKTLKHIELIESEIDKKEILTDFDKLAIENIKLKKNLLSSGVLEQYSDFNMPNDHLIHGDYLGTNVFFNNNNEVSHVFDFEKTKYSSRLYELFRLMMYDFLTGEVNNEKIRKAKLYLDSYLDIYPASKNELKMGLELFYVKNVHILWVEDEHYLKNNYRADQFLLSDFERIKYLSENLEELENKLFE